MDFLFQVLDLRRDLGGEDGVLETLHVDALSDSLFARGAEEEFLDRLDESCAGYGGRGRVDEFGDGGCGGVGCGFGAGSRAFDGVGDGEGCLYGDVVLDEEVCGGVGGAPDKLADLEECQDALEVCWDFVAEGVEGVVGVL